MKKLIYVIVALFIFTTCEDANNSDKAVLSVRLTDAPADYQEILIDIQDILINTSSEDDPDGWESLSLQSAGVFNLLDFTNGMDTLLVEQQLPAGTISQMRLVLGNSNQIKINNEYYNLETPSSKTSGLKFNIHATLVEGINYKLWIDFDAGRSIVNKGNGSFLLKPVIRTYTEAQNGAITGIIHPVESKPYIMAISEMNDTLGTYADTVNGYFLIGGLDAGIYDLKFMPGEMYSEKMLQDVEVMIGDITDVDTVKINMQ